MGMSRGGRRGREHQCPEDVGCCAISCASGDSWLPVVQRVPHTGSLRCGIPETGPTD